jgi:hypothetical protein
VLVASGMPQAFGVGAQLGRFGIVVPVTGCPWGGTLRVAPDAVGLPPEECCPAEADPEADAAAEADAEAEAEADVLGPAAVGPVEGWVAVAGPALSVVRVDVEPGPLVA